MHPEDKYLCKHDWRDMYQGDGVDQLRYKLNPDYLAEFEADDNDSDNLTASV